MSKKVETGEPKAAKGTAQPDIATIMATNGENWRAFMQAGEVMLQGMTELGREMMDFGNARLRHDMTTSESLMRCNGVEDAFRLQCDYARDATQQYFEEAGKLMQLTASMTRKCWAPLEDRTRAALQQLNGD